MLLRITRYCDLARQNLMEVYSESNYENTDYFYPDETDKRNASYQRQAQRLSCRHQRTGAGYNGTVKGG